MPKQFDDIMRAYSFRKDNFPKIRTPWFFSKKLNTELIEHELFRKTAGQRVDITQNILKTLEEALGRKVEVAGIRGEDLPAELAFSIGNGMNFMLTDDKGERVGLLAYALPGVEEDTDLPPYLTSGGLNLYVLGSAIKDERQYNALQIGLRKVQSA